MKKIMDILAVTGAAALSLSSCVKDKLSDRAAAVIEASIENSTRASGTSWTEEDRIGVSTVPGTRTIYTNVPYKWGGSKFNADGEIIYFQSGEAVTFNAYYPYNAAGGTLEAKTDAEAQKNLPAIDFLYAGGASASMTAPTVSFTGIRAFSHRMSQVTVTFEEGDGMEFTDKLEMYTLDGLILEGTFNTETGAALAKSAGTSESLAIRLENVSVSNKRYTAAPVILFPQDVPGGKIPLVVRVAYVNYATELSLPDADGDGVKDSALKPGYSYTFSVRVKKTAIEIASAEIKPWNEVEGDSGDAVLR